MWLLCVSRVVGVHVVIVCQPGGWSTCSYCLSAGSLVLQGEFFPMLMEADCSLLIIVEDPLRNLCYVAICCGVQSSV